MLIFRHIILIFFVTARIDLHALIIKKHITCLALSSAAALYLYPLFQKLSV